MKKFLTVLLSGIMMAGLFTADSAKINEYVKRASDICGLKERLNDKIGTYSRGMIRK